MQADVDANEPRGLGKNDHYARYQLDLITAKFSRKADINQSFIALRNEKAGSREANMSHRS